jgi:hypothetical protein
MAKPKRPRKTTPKMKAKTNDRAADLSRRPPERTWTDLEQAFFASAPPDEPEASPEPESFDDLIPAVPSRRRMAELADRLIATLSAPWLDLRMMTIAIASVMLLIGLSAAVFASRH